MSFDPDRNYPVIEAIYAGPQGSHVPKTWGGGQNLISTAELGFVMAQIDGMGTGNRSKAFHDVAWKDLKDAGFPDRILWHEAASTMQLVDALIRADKKFDLLVVPNGGHGATGLNGGRKRTDFFIEHLLGVAPPNWNAGATIAEDTDDRDQDAQQYAAVPSPFDDAPPMGFFESPEDDVPPFWWW